MTFYDPFGEQEPWVQNLYDWLDAVWKWISAA
jgi:hypothetical protein